MRPIRPVPAGIAVAALAATAAASLIAVPTAIAATSGRPALHLSVGKHHVVSAPRTTAPGLTRIVNSSGSPIVVLQPVDGHATAEQLAKVLGAKHLSTTKLDRTAKIVADVNGRSQAITRLHRGEIFVFDGNVSKLTADKLTKLDVRGAARNTATPTAASIGLAKNGTLQAPARLRSGEYVRFRSAPPITTALAMLVGPKTTQQQIDDVVAHPTPSNFEKLQIVRDGSPVLFPTAGSYLSPYLVHPGRWLVVELDTRHKTLFRKGAVCEVVVG